MQGHSESSPNSDDRISTEAWTEVQDSEAKLGILSPTLGPHLGPCIAKLESRGSRGFREISDFEVELASASL